jgi:hypothetical protein
MPIGPAPDRDDDEFDPRVRRRHGQLGEPQRHLVDNDDAIADEDEAQRARAGADFVPFSVAAARVKSPPKSRRVEPEPEPEHDEDDGKHRGYVVHHLIHHQMIITPHPHDLADEDEEEEHEQP